MSNNWLYSGDRSWYTRINQKDGKQGLLEYHSLKYLEGKTVICYENYKSVRYFTVFETFLHFILTLLGRPEDDRSFHEVIFGEFPLKLFFDIDVNLLEFSDFREEVMISEIVRSVLAYFKSEGISLIGARNFVWLTSHGEYKKSYHLIIDGYFFFNMDEINYAIDSIKRALSSNIREYFDWGVYISRKNFRTLGSYKRGTKRKFIFVEKWEFEGKVVKYEYPNNEDDSINEISPEKRKLVFQFEASLITNTAHCNPMMPKVQHQRKQYEEVPDCDSFVVKQGMEMLAKVGDISIEKLPFTISAVSGKFILLKREESTLCMICNRVHDNQNPFIMVKETPETREFIYYCRQARERVNGVSKCVGKSIGIIVKEQPKVDPDFSVGKSSLQVLQDRRNPDKAKEGAKRTNKSYKETSSKMLDSI